MENVGIELEVEEQDVAGFLGISIKRSGNTIKLSQEGLIKCVVDALGIGHLPRQYTPASAVPLVKDPDGDLPYGDYNYTSVIGIIQYLQVYTHNKRLAILLASVLGSLTVQDDLMKWHSSG